MSQIGVALEIMGLGMLGIFAALLIIMAVTMLLNKADKAAAKKEKEKNQ